MSQLNLASSSSQDSYQSVRNLTQTLNTTPVQKKSPTPPTNESNEKTQTPKPKVPPLKGTSLAQNTENDINNLKDLSKQKNGQMQSTVHQLSQNSSLGTPKAPSPLNSHVSFQNVTMQTISSTLTNNVIEVDSEDETDVNNNNNNNTNTPDLSRVSNPSMLKRNQSSTRVLSEVSSQNQDITETLIMHDLNQLDSNMKDWLSISNTLDYYKNFRTIRNCGMTKSGLIDKVFLGPQLGPVFNQCQGTYAGQVKEKKDCFSQKGGVQRVQISPRNDPNKKIDVIQGYGVNNLRSVIGKSEQPMVHVIDLIVDGDKFFGHVYILEQFGGQNKSSKVDNQSNNNNSSEANKSSDIQGQLHQSFHEVHSRIEWNNSDKGGISEDLLKHLDKLEKLVNTNEFEERMQLYGELFLINDEELEKFKNKSMKGINETSISDETKLLAGTCKLQIVFSSIPYDRPTVEQNSQNLNEMSDTIINNSTPELEAKKFKASSLFPEPLSLDNNSNNNDPNDTRTNVKDKSGQMESSFSPNNEHQNQDLGVKDKPKEKIIDMTNGNTPVQKQGPLPNNGNELVQKQGPLPNNGNSSKDSN